MASLNLYPGKRHWKHSGVSYLKEVLETDDIEPLYFCEVDPKRYMLTFSSVKLNFIYDVILDYHFKIIFINTLQYPRYNTQILLLLICGIINNNNNNFIKISINATGNPLEIEEDFLYYYCALYGFTPSDTTLEYLLNKAKLKGYDFKNAHGLFHTSEGLSYWFEFGEAFKAEFLLLENSKNKEYFEEELRLKQLQNWLI